MAFQEVTGFRGRVTRPHAVTIIVILTCAAGLRGLPGCHNSSGSAPGLAPPAGPPAGRGRIEVVIRGCRNREGQMLISLFSAEEGFPQDASKAFRKMRSPIAGESVAVSLEDVPFGTYAVAVLHDENLNEVMDTNLIGIPREGAGASRNPRVRFGPPRFGESVFVFDRDPYRMEVDLRYPP